MLPKGAVTADFVEAVPKGSRLLVAIGDAPSTGIKSAFVARFIANVFSALVAASADPKPADLLNEVSRRILGHNLRVGIDAVRRHRRRGGPPRRRERRPSVSRAYVARRQKWDCLPVRGQLLHSVELDSMKPHHYEHATSKLRPGTSSSWSATG